MNNTKEKKHEQLGMNYSTASGRLVKDLLFEFVSATCPLCHRCGEVMERENFSIDHTTPWLDSVDPIGLFFDTSNISYSHLSCNSSAARRTLKKYDSAQEQRTECERRRRGKREYNKEYRLEYYIKNGK